MKWLLNLPSWFQLHQITTMSMKLNALISSLLLLLLSNVFPCSSHSLNNNLKKQASILVSIKKTFQSYDPNSGLDSWTTSNYFHLCRTWSGVQCDRTNTSVVSLDVSGFNISAPFLSPLITSLPTLVNLSVSGNSFSGRFPPEIHKLSRLQLLNISENQFMGDLNWNFSRLKELRFLDVYDNSFNGSLPLGVTELKTLKHLDLGGNYFTGNIPKSYATMQELIYLSVKGNDLSGFIPRELGNLSNLQYLYLGYYNQFHGGIPAELGKLANLVHLDLANCSLEGPIPPELGNLTKLDTLYLQTNGLSGRIPGEIGNLVMLQRLDLSNNVLTGEIPLEFSGLQQLTLLNLFINNLHGEIPPFVVELTSLQVLNLWRNNFTGSIPEKLGENGRLVDLDLSSNKLTGLLPRSLCLGRKLEILILRFNFLFGPLPEDLGRCYSLTRVRVGHNYLTGSIPPGFVYLPRLSLLELQSNYLTGSVPEQRTGTSSKLEQLNLSENRLLSGEIPSSIGNFSSLQILLLSGNRFTGEIPAEIGRLKSVLTLDLSRNNLTGDVPAEIGNLPMLTFLDLSQNQLSGQIPVQISRIHILNYFNVSWNHMTSSLPKEIGSMKSLTSADFSHNNFSGAVPEFGQYLFFNFTSFVGNSLLCGYYSNPCNKSLLSPFQSPNETESKSKVSGKFKLLLAVGLLFCSVVFVVLAIIKTRRNRKNSRSWKLTAFQKLDFTCEEILESMKENNVIGRGGAGIVYKGVMRNGEEVAVKKLLAMNKGSSHDNGLSAEIQTLGRIRHRNIVRLLGFCSNKQENLLVYEYMPNGSLGEVLHGKRGGFLRWETRLKIAVEAAKGLCYLHHDCSPLIIHRDVKSNNILLDSEFEAHVADFGLAKFFQDNGTSQCMSAIAGSYGYIAPEYAYTLRVDEKSDVYSFGIVLLELLTGRRPVGDFGEEGIDIVQWTKMQTNSIKERVIKILDERLDEIPLNEAIQVFFVAMLCVEEQSVERPTMREVVQMLAQAKQPNTFYLH